MIVLKRVLLVLLSSSALAFASEVQEGAQLVRVGGCVDCHTQRLDRPLAGGVPVNVSGVGLFFPPNLTPEPRTGLGNWTFENFKTAMRDGRAPDGHAYWPVFPYRAYTKITDEDLTKIWAYLRSVPPVENQTRPHLLRAIYSLPGGTYAWQQIFFGTLRNDPLSRIRAGHGAFQPDPARSAAWNRGAYLSEAMLHCAECHTRREFNGFGAPDLDAWMGGSNVPVGGYYAPNITPGRLKWSAEDWDHFLVSGKRPSGEGIRAKEMIQVIQNVSALSASDRAALIEYMRSLAPVE